MTGREIVREVICLLNGGSKWAKGSYMQNRDGRHLDSNTPQAPEAASFCLLGAAHRVLGLTEFQRVKNHDALKEFAVLIRESLSTAQIEEVKRSGYVSKHFNETTGEYEEDPGDYVVCFNDHGGTTFDQIEKVLAKALVRKGKNRRRKPKSATV